MLVTRCVDVHAFRRTICRRVHLEAQSGNPPMAPSECSEDGPDLFRFFSQLRYHHAQILGFASMIRSPHCLQEPLMSERLAAMDRQHAKHFELLGSEMNARSADFENSSLEIDGQRIRPCAQSRWNWLLLVM